MVNTIRYLVFISVLILTSHSANSSPDIESVIKDYFLDTGSSRLSGKGTYLHEVYKAAINVNEFTEGVEFKDAQHKNQYLGFIRMSTGLDFKLKQDTTLHSIETFYYENNKARKDVADIPQNSVQSILQGELPNDLIFTTYAYDGSKTIAIIPESTEKPDALVAAISNDSIFVPKFQRFGLNDSEKDVDIYIDAINNGMYSISGFAQGNTVHANMELSQMGVRIEFAFDSTKNMALLQSRLYMGGNLVTETICQDYQHSEGGKWYPLQYTTNKYAHIKGKNILTYSESYKGIKDSIDFNIPIDSSIFSPKLSPGTYVMDLRYSPALEYFVEDISNDYPPEMVVTKTKDADINKNSKSSSRKTTNKSMSDLDVPNNLDRNKSRLAITKENANQITEKDKINQGGVFCNTKYFYFSVVGVLLLLICISYGCIKWKKA